MPYPRIAQRIGQRIGTPIGGLLAGQGASAPAPPALDAPANLAITSVVNGSIAPQADFTLTWDAVTDAESYIVHAYTNAALSAEATLADSGAAASNSYTFTATDLTYLTEYWLTVEAVGDGVTTGDSDESSALPMVTPLPAAVTDYFFAGTRSDLLNGGITEDSGATDICEDDEPVYNWASINGGYVPTQAVQAKRPVFHADSFGSNNRPFVEYTGTQDLVDASADPIVIDDATFTIFVVFNTDSIILNGSLVNIYDAANPATAKLRLFINANVVNRSQYEHVAGGVTNAQFVDKTINDGSPRLMVMKRASTTSYNVYVDGTARTSPNDSDNVGASSADTLRLGTYKSAVDVRHYLIGGQALIGFCADDVLATVYNGETIPDMINRFYGTVWA